jgi:hypothetical protein
MLKLEELEVYQMAMEIGEQAWDIVDEWKPFAKRTVGEQLVEAADSIAANISEGYGRYHYKENRQFCLLQPRLIDGNENISDESEEQKTHFRKAVHGDVRNAEDTSSQIECVHQIHRQEEPVAQILGNDQPSIKHTQSLKILRGDSCS